MHVLAAEETTDGHRDPRRRAAELLRYVRGELYVYTRLCISIYSCTSKQMVERGRVREEEAADTTA